MINRFNLMLGLQVVLILVLFFALHLGLSIMLGFYNEWDGMGISLFGIYGFGFILTCLIYIALIGIHFSMPQNVGYVFLGLIAVRGIASYLLIDRYMEVSASADFLKYNFFASFLIFLMTDAFMAYRVLNK